VNVAKAKERKNLTNPLHIQFYFIVSEIIIFDPFYIDDEIVHSFIHSLKQASKQRERERRGDVCWVE
jgi:hypothetical protein